MNGDVLHTQNTINRVILARVAVVSPSSSQKPADGADGRSAIFVANAVLLKEKKTLLLFCSEFINVSWF